MKYLIVPCCLFFHPILYAEDILVLAHKISPEDRETSSVKVFDEEDIISLQAHTVMDLLKGCLEFTRPMVLLEGPPLFFSEEQTIVIPPLLLTVWK